jgi:hypothetical protein
MFSSNRAIEGPSRVASFRRLIEGQTVRQIMRTCHPRIPSSVADDINLIAEAIAARAEEAIRIVLRME